MANEQKVPNHISITPDGRPYDNRSNAQIIDESAAAPVPAAREQEIKDLLKSSERMVLGINGGLREILDRWHQPCLDACEHADCPLLRELGALVWNPDNKAQYDNVVRAASAPQGDAEKYQELLKFFGATESDDGSIEVDMKKYNAAHRCETHRKIPWREHKDLERCVGCLHESLAALRSHRDEAAIRRAAFDEAIAVVRREQPYSQMELDLKGLLINKLERARDIPTEKEQS